MVSGPTRVLLIEDDEEDYFITLRLLMSDPEGNRFTLVWARTLQEGLQAIDGAICAVLLDLSLPDSTGWSTFERVRKATPHLPIILLTGLQDESLGVLAVHDGAQDYLIKGQIDSDLLERAILLAIERKRIENRLAQVAEELQAKNRQLEDELSQLRRDLERRNCGHSTDGG